MTTQALDIAYYDHAKIVCEDVPRFEKTLSVLGFQRQAHAPEFFEKPHAVWGSGEAVYVIYQKDHPLAKKAFETHGDTVFDLSFGLQGGDRERFEIMGVGDMKHTIVSERSFPSFFSARGILKFDHNTINVDMGKLETSVCDYLVKFQLQKGQFFDIKTEMTGLKSWVTRTSNFGVQIPFNEATEEESQIQEYIRVHKGPGVQHMALLSENIIKTMDAVTKDPEINFEFLDIPDTYYELAQQRVTIKEPMNDLERLRILVDQDKEGGYLLQIFTQNLFGGFFFELIQREGNIGFGEGNFQALFESIELDQKRRGVL